MATGDVRPAHVNRLRPVSGACDTVRKIGGRMSKQNGDRARYQRLRQAGLRRRERSRAVQAELKARAAPAATVVADAPRVESGVQTKAEGV